MNQSNKKNSLDEIIRVTKHNSKANEVFLKLLAKQKRKKVDWNSLKAETLIPSKLK